MQRHLTGLLSLAAVVSGAALAVAQGDAIAGRFIAHTIGTDLTGGYQVVVADLNRDRKPDIIAVASGLKELRWYENPGWQSHVLVSGINQPINAAAHDVDGDGIPRSLSRTSSPTCTREAPASSRSWRIRVIRPGRGPSKRSTACRRHTG